MVSVGAKKTRDFASRCAALAMEMLKLRAQHMWLDYDREADMLYVSFRKPQRTTETIEMDDDILVRKDGKDIVGLTILNTRSK